MYVHECPYKEREVTTVIETATRGTSVPRTTGCGWRRDIDEATAVFLDVRPRLFQIAHRILGSVCEAEDVLQDVWLRWQRADRRVVANPTAFLVTITSRTAINVARSARMRRETLNLPLMEPAEAALDPAEVAERGEAVESAVLILLQRLSPYERAAYVLREAFDYPYYRIAEILHLRADNTRQLVSRAHAGLASQRDRPVTPAGHRRLHRAFVSAAATGRLTDHETVLVAQAGR
jgi:RNA polymerase sigma-70 factor (ECF subfamily)